MNSTLFKVKFTFAEPNDKGKIKKSKLEIIAQCENYTDAEKLCYKVAEDYEMDKYEPYAYEIVRLKFTPHDVLYNRSITYSNNLVCGLVQNFFENELENFFIVNVTIFGNEDDNSKDAKMQFCVPAIDAVAAINHVTKRMAYNNYRRDEYEFTSVKVDGASEAYFTPQTHEALLNSIIE